MDPQTTLAADTQKCRKH